MYAARLAITLGAMPRPQCGQRIVGIGGLSGTVSGTANSTGSRGGNGLLFGGRPLRRGGWSFIIVGLPSFNADMVLRQRECRLHDRRALAVEPIKRLVRPNALCADNLAVVLAEIDPE